MTFYSVSNPFMQVLNLQGTGLNDGDVYFGIAGQDPITHPKVVYWDLAGTEVAPQPIPTTGGYLYRSGTPANVYINDTYSIKVLDKNGGLVYYQANVFDPVFQIAEDLAAFEASIGGPDGSSEMGYSLGSGSDSTQTVEARLRRFVVLTDFEGVVGDGTTDCTEGIRDAIAWGMGEGGNVTFYVPKGRFLITDTIVMSATFGLSFVGAGRWSTTWLSSVLTGPTFEFDGATNGTMRDIACQYTGSPSAGAIFFYLRNGSYTHVFSDMRAITCWTWFQIGNDPATGDDLAGDISILRPIGTAYNGGQPFIYTRRGVGLWLDSPRCPVGGPNTPVSPTVINRDPTNTVTVVAGTTFLKIEGTFDTINLTGNGIIEHFDHGVWLNALGNGEVIQNFEMQSGWFFDYHQNQAYYVTAAAGLGGIFGCHFRGYALSWGNNTMEIVADGVVRDVTWIDPINYVAGKCNFKMSGINHVLCGITSSGAGTATLEAADRINTGAASIDISGGQYPIVAGIAGGIDGTYGGYGWQPPFGLKWGPDINQPKFVDNRMFGGTGGFDAPTNTVASGGLILNNSGMVNYGGLQAFATPSSGVPYQNKTGFKQIIYWSQGTFSGVTLNGGLIAAGPGVVTLSSGDTMIWTYTGSPTFTLYQDQ